MEMNEEHEAPATVMSETGDHGDFGDPGEHAHETDAQARTGEPTSEERNWALAGHLGIFAGTLIGLPCVVTLVIYLVQRGKSPFAEQESREALNFQITLLLLALASIPLIFLFGLGILVLLVVALMGIVLPILAAISVSEGRGYRYPWTVRLVR